MASRKPAVVQLGDELYEVEAATPQAVSLIHRVTGERRSLPHHELSELVKRDEHRTPRQLDSLPKHVIEAANALAIDIEEVRTGIGRNGKRRPQYDLETTTQEGRVRTKLEEMEFAGRNLGRSQFFAKMKAFDRDGLIGLVDGRALRKFPSRVDVLDFRILEVLIAVIDGQLNRSTGTTSRIIRETAQAVRDKYGPIPLPGKSKFYALVEDLGGGKHATGSAKTRRSLGNRPDRPFAKQEPLLPGSSVQIDTNTMDVEVRTPEGERIRPELTIMTDVFSRSIIAFTMRTGGTKAVDHMMLVTQAITPRQSRPSRSVWRDWLRRDQPDLKLLSEEEYAAHVQAIPFIHPRDFTTDRGTPYTAKTFRDALGLLGGSIVLSAPYTPTSKPHVERQFHSVNTLFAQHLSGYVSRSSEHKGKEEPTDKLLTLEALRELFEDWVVSEWQNRKHSKLRDPVNSRLLLSPNEKAARAALTVEQLRTSLSREDFIRMLDTKRRTIRSTGVSIDNRDYDSPLLHELKGRKSADPRHGGKWEVKVDPYNPTSVWVVGRNGELIECVERGAEKRYYQPEFAAVDDLDYRALTAQSENELLGAPALATPVLPKYTAPELDSESESDDDSVDDLFPEFD
jgi:transposase InsO family protein